MRENHVKHCRMSISTAYTCLRDATIELPADITSHRVHSALATGDKPGRKTPKSDHTQSGCRKNRCAHGQRSPDQSSRKLRYGTFATFALVRTRLSDHKQRFRWPFHVLCSITADMRTSEYTHTHTHIVVLALAYTERIRCPSTTPNPPSPPFDTDRIIRQDMPHSGTGTCGRTLSAGGRTADGADGANFGR